MIRRALAAILLLVGATVSAQPQPAVAGSARTSEVGRPLIRNYTPEEYQNGGQNWGILQDRRGVLWIAASNGVLSYDGATWRTIELPNQGTVRSLGIDDGGRIYVGGTGELGYLEPDAHGDIHYVSLLDKIPADSRTFEDVWRLFVTPEGVYFQTQVSLFRWASGTMRVWKPSVRFNRASYANGKLYLPEPGVGMMVMDGDRLEPLPGAERFGAEPYPVILPYDNGRLLMGTRDDGFFLYDGTTLTPFPTEVDAFIKSSQLYRGFPLPDGTIALTTTQAGVAIIDREGHRRAMIDKRSGLRDNQVYYAMPDRQGALWLALGDGISRVETPSPASFYTDADGMPAAPFDMIRHAGRFYAATTLGTFYLDPTPGPTGFPQFLKVSGVQGQCWGFAEIAGPGGKGDSELLLAASAGVFRIEGDKAIPVLPGSGKDYQPAVVYQSHLHPDRVWVALFDGLMSIRRVAGHWASEGRVEGVPDAIRSVAEAEDGTLWAGTQTNGILRLTFDYAKAAEGTRPAHPTIDRFGVAAGLPPGGGAVWEVARRPYFSATGTPIMHFDGKNGTFVKDDTFAVVSAERNSISGVIAGTAGDVWVSGNFQSNSSDLVRLVRQADGTYRRGTVPFKRFWGGGFPYAESDGVVWFAANDRFYRYDTSQQRDDRSEFTALVRRVTINQKTELYGGASAVAAPTLEASDKALRFEFAAPSFYDTARTEYRSRLDGLDSDWSAWTKETRRDYTNLGFGSYRFRLQARDVRGKISEEAGYGFVILPPWYRTWWAYALYALLAAAFGFGVDRLQRRRLTAKERQRSAFNEARLRAESAEALAKSERDRKKNIELLSAIGREITASLDFDTIFGKLYEHINQFADADVFGVGLYHPDRREIEYRLAIENGKRYAPYTRDASDRNQFPVWCIEHREPIFINDVAAEYGRYISSLDEQRRPLEDGSMSRAPQSLIYLPLVSKDRVLGIITIQSFEKHAYTEHHLNVMQSLAAYTSIALDNAAAYRQLNEQEHEIRRLFEEAQQARSAAEEADAAKSAFLSTVSHELRTPLTSVLGFAKIIKKRLEDRIFPLIQSDDRRVQQTMQQVEDNLKVVVSEGERLTKLIDDVLDLAKIEAGKLEWHMELGGRVRRRRARHGGDLVAARAEGADSSSRTWSRAFRP